MKVIKEILGRLFAVWAIVMFVVTMLLFFIPFFLFSYLAKEPTKTIRFVMVSRVWMRVYLTAIGCPLFVRGRNNFAPGQTYIVICNHNSLMDVPVSFPFIPGGNKTIAKIEMAKTPVFGYMYRTGSILVDRKSEVSRKESYASMKKVLAMGLHMCIYPEGTRNKTDQPLKSFHDGAFRLAIDTRKALLPAIIFNTKKALPANKPFYFFPYKLYFDFLPPVPIGPNDTVESLKEKLHGIMSEYYAAHQ